MNNGFKKACVTGGAGFIGSKLVRRLLQQGIDVLVIDNLSVGLKKNIPAHAQFIEGDILQPEVVAHAADCDVVFHLAARVAIRSSFEFVTEDVMANVVGTVNLLRAVTMPESQVRKFIFASSMAVYADQEGPVAISEDAVPAPVSPYGISKFSAEMLVRQLCEQAGIEAGILRLFNTYGNGQALSPYVGVMTIFANAMLEGKTPFIFGDGLQSRDFVHVDDVVSGFLLAMENARGGNVYNIGSGEGLTINEVYQIIADKLNFPHAAEYKPLAAGEMRFSIADIDKARSQLNYQPQYHFASAIGDILNEIESSR